MSIVIAIFAAALFLAYANGANDNFKGVATLYGSGTASFRTALAWATISTFAGSLAAAVFADELLKLFSGKGLVPDWLLTSPAFLLSVILGAALTVFITAIRGIPISTTHALVGGLAGAGFIAAGSDLNLERLGQSFFLPLAIGPLIPILLIGGLYPLIRWAVQLPLAADWIGQIPRPKLSLARISIQSRGLKREQSDLDEVAFAAKSSLVQSGTALHFLSAGAVGFARGLNDTPKIVGIAAAAQAAQLEVSTLLIAIAMAIGGLVQSRRVAETISTKITELKPAAATFGNVVTSLLVIGASRLGLPMSTTHVSVGSIMGIGIAERNANWRLLTGILTAWLLTLPCAAALAATAYWFLSPVLVAG